MLQKTGCASVIVSVALIFIGTELSFPVCASYARKVTFGVQLYGGREYRSQYEFVEESACIYENSTDLLTCMGIYKYSDVTFAWKFWPETFLYIKVNCRRQEFLFSYPQVCLCKNYDMSKEASSFRNSDSFTVCHLKELHAGIFAHLSLLKDLDLSWNDIVEVEPFTFRGLPNLVYVNLSNNKLKSLPPGIFCGLPSLWYVDLSSTSMTVLPSISRGCESKIVNLFMSNGILKEIPVNAFDNLNSLTWLDLSHNQIHKLPGEIFRGEKSLRILDLSQNAIDALPENFCQNLTRLEELHLHHNSFINWIHFSSCPKLQILDLSYNQLTHFSGNLSLTPLLSKLNLAGNKLVKLESNVNLVVYWHLQALDLSQNGLREVTSEFLEPARHLKNLSLAQNCLSEITVNLTELLSSTFELEMANFSFNNFTVLQADAFPNLHELRTLDFSHNMITEIHPESLTGLIGLQKLYLRGNYLQSLLNNTLSRIGNLSIIDLSKNELSEVESLPVSLMEANLGGNRLYDLPSAFRMKNFTSLVKLLLHGNKLTTLDKDCFSGLTALEILDLSYNQLHTIGRDTFVRLAHLQILNLEGNKLALDFRNEVLRGAISLKWLNMAFNRISSISGLFHMASFNLWKVTLVNLTGNPIMEIHEVQVQNLDLSLDTLVLDRCNLTYIDQQAFYGLSSVKHVLLRNNQLEEFPPFYINKSDVNFQLSGNPVVCSCNMKWIKEDFWKEYGILITVARYYIDTCLNPVQNKIMDIRKVDRDDFLCGTHLSCDEKCICFSSIEGAEPDVVKCQSSLRHLPRLLSDHARRIDLSGNDFESLGNLETFNTESIFHTEEFYLNHSRVKSFKSNFFTVHPLLNILHLEVNLITSLSEDIFGNLVLLEELYLNNNLLSVLFPGTFAPLKSLRILDLRANNFSYIHSAVTDRWTKIVPLHHIYLSQNPWFCSCRSVSFRDWLVKSFYLVPDWRNTTCSGISIMEQTQETFICSELTLPKVYIDHGSKGLIIGLLFLVVFIIVSATLVYRMRKNLLAVTFVKLKWSPWRPKWEKDKYYDAFLLHNIYHQEGTAEKWVKDTLLSKLEQGQKPYKMFVPDRDIHLGDSVVDTSYKAIDQSRRTIVVVSESFAASHWCNRIFQYAYKRVLENKGHRIIIVLYGKVKLEELDPAIKAFVMMGDYISVDSWFFWERLFFELPDPRISDVPVSENDAGVLETDIILGNAIAIDGEMECSSHV